MRIIVRNKYHARARNEFTIIPILILDPKGDFVTQGRIICRLFRIARMISNITNELVISSIIAMDRCLLRPQSVNDPLYMNK